jgi:hypothetical protein
MRFGERGSRWKGKRGLPLEVGLKRRKINHTFERRPLSNMEPLMQA